MRRIRTRASFAIAVGGLLALSLLAPGLAAAAPKPQVAPGTPSFQNTWARTDQPVATGRAARTWMWGPQAFSESISEPYQQSPGGQRQVQYYDKSRMEITNPNAVDDGVWYVTNGLLVNELVTGQMQIGDAQFETHQPAQVNVVGDPDDQNGPTYATFGPLLTAAPVGGGTTITQRVNRAGAVSNDGSLAGYGVTAAQYVPETNHQIASVFWAFMNSSGTVYQNGSYSQAALFQSPYYATGYPVTEAYWANVKVAGTAKDVLLQCFQRRCLSYTPTNPEGWKVEAGNVGQHYYLWRHCGDSCQRVLAQDGGVVELPGEVRVTIPGGGLVEDAIVSITRVPGIQTAALTQTIVSDRYDIESGGIALRSNVTIEIAYDPSALPAGASEANVVIGYYDSTSGAWKSVPSQVNQATHTVSGQTNHFSRWAAWVESDGGPTIPSTPAGLSAQANGPNQIGLQWTDASTNEDGFRVYETTGGGQSVVQSLGANATSWTATNLAANSRHCYRVAAYNGVGESVWSNEACAQTGGTAPNAPSNLMAHTYDSTTIQLMWQDNSNDEDGWYIYMDGALLGQIDPSNPCSPTDCYAYYLEPNTYYCFNVSAYNEYGESQWSNEACAWTDDSGSAPNAPSNLMAYTYDSTSIQLTWYDNSSDEHGWYIYIDDQRYTVDPSSGCVPSGCLVYQLLPDTYYCFYVSAYNDYGESGWSNEACAWTASDHGGAPNAPSYLSASTYDSTTIELSWQDNSSDEDGWYIYMDGDLLGQIDPSNPCTPHDCYAYYLEPGTYYCFNVSAYNEYGESAWSNEACAWTSSSSFSLPNDAGTPAVGTKDIHLDMRMQERNE